MDFRIERLRRGEVIVGVAAALLLVFTFLLPWYGTKLPIGRTAAILGAATSFNGWHSLSHVRWLVLLTILASLALVFFQATRRAPAIPVAFSVIVSTLALLTVLALIYRVLINVPGSGDLVDQRVGAYLGLVSSVAILYGGYESMRQEGILPEDGPAEIEVARLGGASGAS